MGPLARFVQDLYVATPSAVDVEEDAVDMEVIRVSVPEPVLTLALSTDGNPPLGSATAPTLPLHGRPADPEKLTEARQLFFGKETVGRLGPYSLISDVTDAALLSLLDGIAVGVQESYVQRYGRVPIGRAVETIVVYRREGPYRLLLSKWNRIHGLPASGHTGFGLVASYQGDRLPAELAQTLVHELVHLLNRRALGPALPPWLDEGIADDLSYSRTTSSGHLILGSLGEIRIEAANRYVLKGGLASLALLAQPRHGEWSGLPALLDLDWQGFVGVDDIGLHYAESTFLVRCLLADRCGDGSRESFSSFLKGISEGGSAESSALLLSLDSEWSQVEAALRLYVRGEALEHGVLSEETEAR